MTIRDPDTGQLLEVEIRTFTGPNADATLLDPDGRQVRGHYLMDAAPSPGGSDQKRFRSKAIRTERKDKGTHKERRAVPREGKAA